MYSKTPWTSNKPSIRFEPEDEHLDAVGLIHMNGRVYDPVAGRFLGVDPVIELGNSQSVNSYSYVWNNPLSLIDPSGFQAAPPDVVTQGQPSPRNLCPYRIANIGMRCVYRYGWRWDIDPYDRWLLDEYMYEAWAQARTARGGLAGQQPGGTPGEPVVEDFGTGAYAIVDKQFFKDMWNNAIQEVLLDPLESAQAAYEACTGGSGRKCARDVLNALCEVIKTCDALKGLKKTGKIVREIVQDSRAARATGATVRNAHLAGKVHPKTGIPFDRNGFPDFSKVSRSTVQIPQTGNRAADFAAANRAAGFPSTPRGYTWHHHQDGKTMQLVPTDIHRATGHTGGVALGGGGP